MVDNNVYDMASKLEPFFDDWLIETMDGLSLRLDQPARREIVLELDRPWEGKSSGSYVSVFPDGDIYRMYYRGSEWNVDPNVNVRPVVCYAESRDGIRWERPDLGIFEHEGSVSNNIVRPEMEGHDNFMAFKDLNPDAHESQRYKAVEGRPDYGFMGFVSPDGIHWQRSSEEPFFTDDRHYDWISTAFWDGARGSYVAYLRSWITDAEHGSIEIMNRREIGSATPIRTIRRCTSDDFASWTDTRLIEYDVPLSPGDQLYTNGIMPYPRAPHILIGLPRRFTPLRKKAPRLSEPRTVRRGVHDQPRRNSLEEVDGGVHQSRPGPDELGRAKQHSRLGVAGGRRLASYPYIGPSISTRQAHEFAGGPLERTGSSPSMGATWAASLLPFH